jgi:hypothetical protein
VLRVTVSKTGSELQTLSQWCKENNFLEVKEAIVLLATKLPILLLNAIMFDISQVDRLIKLQILADAAQEARDVIFVAPTIHKETVWHDAAQLIEWHWRRLLVAAQTAEHGWSRNVLVHQIESGLFNARAAPSPTSPGPCPRRNPISPRR